MVFACDANATAAQAEKYRHHSQQDAVYCGYIQIAIAIKVCQS
jgi:hypothetical protein